MLTMPLPDQDVLARRAEIVEALRKIVPGEGVIDSEGERRAYESDGLTAYRTLPMVVVLPENTAQVVGVMKYCNQAGVKVVPRGAGTSLSGGALPLEDGVLLGLGKFNKILEIDVANRCVVTQPGVTNLGITNAVQDQGFYYAPDPSSQIACTIGGNVAENSGGVHCLKYGLTTNNVLGIEMVTIDGEVVRLGGKNFDGAGYDLLGVMVGSEGLLGVVTEVTVRILPKPPGARALLVGFPTIEGAGDCVAAVIAAGIIPGGMEMMDKPATAAAEAFVHAGYPLDAEAVLIVELDGCQPEVDHLINAVEQLAQQHGASTIRTSQSEEERLLFWAGRKAAFPAVGRIAPDYYCMDGTIPRKRLGDVLLRMKQMEAKHNLKVANVFHAGDGNLHPLILYDANVPGELDRAEEFGNDILRLCVEVGGVLTGEHGVGVEKRDLMPTMFNKIDLDQQQRLKCAFDPDGLLNPGKMFPELCRCAELGRMHVHAGKVRFPELPRFFEAMTVFRPSEVAEIEQVVSWAAAEKESVEIVAGGSKRRLGRPEPAKHTLDVSGINGIIDYEPSELVITARAGTKMAEIEAQLSAQHQMFAFEPPDWGALLGGEGEPTLGGVLACNMAGPRRIRAGAARDHFLGFSAVNGWGDAWKAGGRVVKNVTGYDVGKLQAGAYGTLSVLTEASLKVLPAPETSCSLVLTGLADQSALLALANALNSPHEVSAAAHLPAEMVGRSKVADIAGLGASATVIRLEGFRPSVEYRAGALEQLLGPVIRLQSSASAALWREIGSVQPLLSGTDSIVWRVCPTPSQAPEVLRQVQQRLGSVRGFYDWGGGLLWLDLDPAEAGADCGAAAIRGALNGVGGHAMLLRAPDAARETVPVFDPQPPALEGLTRRVKAGFDPQGVLNPGRMYKGV